jgi:hypothetical protein
MRPGVPSLVHPTIHSSVGSAIWIAPSIYVSPLAKFEEEKKRGFLFALFFVTKKISICFW